MTVRTLETLIRLATAHARARLSIKIEAEDAACAIALVEYAIFKKVNVTGNLFVCMFKINSNNVFLYRSNRKKEKGRMTMQVLIQKTKMKKT